MRNLWIERIRKTPVKIAAGFLLLCLALCCRGAVRAEEARDLAEQCTYRMCADSVKKPSALFNHEYGGYWQSGRGRYNWLEVHLPPGETCSGVQIKWAEINKNWCIEIKKDGKWEQTAGYEQDYLTTWTPLEGVTEFRIAAHNGYPNRLRINELNVLSAGERPDWVQVWEPVWEKADLLLVVAHPDDEYVFMGGIIPYYGAERGKRVLVAYITESSCERRTELLDGLWTVGQRSYPLIGKFYDRYTMNMETAYRKLGKAKTRRYMVELFRKYRPDVVVTHDIHGEYGHGVHKICADIVRYALDKAADPKAEKALAKQYGTWEVPKCYIHLYEKEQIRFDWDAMVLEAFGGKTAFEVADAAWHCHLSQQKSKYRVYMEDSEYDSQVFGLYRSTVGQDTEHNDFFENLE